MSNDIDSVHYRSIDSSVFVYHMYHMLTLPFIHRRDLCPRLLSLAEDVTPCRSWIQIRRVFALWGLKPDKEGLKCGGTLCHRFYQSLMGK